MDPDIVKYSDPTRFTWAYIDNLRAFAERNGTLELPHVVRLLAGLEAETLRRHGERR